MSLKELVDELGVSFGFDIINTMRNNIRRRFYRNIDVFWSELGLSKYGIDRGRFLNELFELGFYGGNKGANNYWAHRGGTSFKSDYEVAIHAGLWNELSIRGS